MSNFVVIKNTKNGRANREKQAPTAMKKRTHRKPNPQEIYLYIYIEMFVGTPYGYEITTTRTLEEEIQEVRRMLSQKVGAKQAVLTERPSGKVLAKFHHHSQPQYV